VRRPCFPLRSSVFATALVILAAPGFSHATLIAIYSRPGESLPADAAASLVQTLRATPNDPVNQKITVRVADTSILSSDFSVPPGVSAHFWSDQTFEYRGFAMEGTQSTFEIGLPSGMGGAEKPEVLKDTVVTRVASAMPLTTGLLGVSLDSKRIEIRYILREPGRVSLELYDLNGRNLGRWIWREVSSGQFHRAVESNQAPRGTVLMRWNSGEVQAVRKFSL
jgi:hypothetical protein